MLNDFATSRFENYISTVSWLRETAALCERMWRRLRTRTALLGWYHRVCSSLFSTVAAGRLHGLSIDLENNEIVLLCQVLQVEFFLHIFANLGDSWLDLCIFVSAWCWLAAAFQSARCQSSISSVDVRGAQSVGERCLSTATIQLSPWSSQSITQSCCQLMPLEIIEYSCKSM